MWWKAQQVLRGSILLCMRKQAAIKAATPGLLRPAGGKEPGRRRLCSAPRQWRQGPEILVLQGLRPPQALCRREGALLLFREISTH